MIARRTTARFARALAAKWAVGLRPISGLVHTVRKRRASVLSEVTAIFLVGF